MDSVNLNVTVDFTNDVVSELSDKIYDHLEDRLKDEVTTSVLDDIDDKIDNWISYNFDIEEHLRGINVNDFVDIEVDSGEIESAARHLLYDYSPTNSCETGQAFTDAVAKAVRYLLLDQDFAEYFIKAIDRYNRSKIKSEIQEELKQKHFNEFKQELEQYSKSISNVVVSNPATITNTTFSGWTQNI